VELEAEEEGLARSPEPVRHMMDNTWIHPVIENRIGYKTVPCIFTLPEREHIEFTCGV